MTILKNTSINLQVCKVEIVKISDVASVNYGSNSVHRSVTLKTGKSWKQIYFTPGKLTFSSEQVNDVAGPSFNNKIVLPYPGEDDSTISDLDNLENGRFLTRITLNSGIIKLIGDLDSPCTCQISFSIEKSGRIIEFIQKSILPAFNFSE